MDESRRKKLREVELKVAEYAQKLEAKGTSNIAQQCDVYRAKLLEVSQRNVGSEFESGEGEVKKSETPYPMIIILNLLLVYTHAAVVIFICCSHVNNLKLHDVILTDQ